MSDNAKCYSTSRAFRATLHELGARHILIPLYTPRWNGKIEPFFGTLDTEWATEGLANSTRRDPLPRVLHSLLRMKVKSVWTGEASFAKLVVGAGD
jgi:transposase InsO family protein